MRTIILPFIRRTRQHHAIEHATMSILSSDHPDLHMLARSDPAGFRVYGPVSTETLRDAIDEALHRLQGGEHDLAIHPNCGTNVVTAGVLAGLAGVLTMAGRERRWWEHIPFALLATTLALLVAQPLGYLAQARITTLADVRGIRLAHIERHAWGTNQLHRVKFEREAAT